MVRSNTGAISEAPRKIEALPQEAAPKGKRVVARAPPSSFFHLEKKYSCFTPNSGDLTKILTRSSFGPTAHQHRESPIYSFTAFDIIKLP